MTNKEIVKKAIKCNHEFDVMCMGKNCTTCDYYDDNTECEIIYAYARGFAEGIEEGKRLASEKQIPKKPLIRCENMGLGISPNETFKIKGCPCCKEDIGEETSYCQNCGQKLDWGEEGKGGT